MRTGRLVARRSRSPRWSSPPAYASSAGAAGVSRRVDPGERAHRRRRGDPRQQMARAPAHARRARGRHGRPWSDGGRARRRAGAGAADGGAAERGGDWRRVRAARQTLAALELDVPLSIEAAEAGVARAKGPREGRRVRAAGRARCRALPRARERGSLGRQKSEQATWRGRRRRGARGRPRDWPAPSGSSPRAASGAAGSTPSATGSPRSRRASRRRTRWSPRPRASSPI